MPLFRTYVPYEEKGILGKEYNQILEGIEEEWVLFLDHDIFLRTNPHWYYICAKTINESDGNVGMFVPCTNRLGNEEQLHPGFPKGENIKEHIDFAKRLFSKYQFKTKQISKGSGMFMLIRKKAWLESGKFPGFSMFQEDYKFCKRLSSAGWKIMRMEGLYVYHLRDRKMDSWIKGEKITKDYAIIKNSYFQMATR